MNILILSWRGPGHPSAGGAETATFEHAKAWVNAGYSVTLFTSLYKEAKKREILGGVNILRSGGQTFGVKINAFYWFLFVSHPKFDLVLDEFHGIPFFTPLYTRVKKLGWIHEVAKEVWWFNPWPKPLNLIPAIIGTIFERFVFSILYKRVPFMTVSESTKHELSNWGIPNTNIAVVHNGVDVVKVHSGKEKKKTAIYLGALSKDKGIEEALRTFVLINEIDKDWQFWIVGKGDESYVSTLKEQAKEMGLVGKIKFWGFVSQRKKFELLRKAHVFVNPSIREGWGLVNIEASSCGTPVIGYKVPGVSDSVVNGKTGVLVERGDTRAMANAIMAITGNKKKYNMLSRESVNWAKRFSWTKAGKESLKLVESI
ncbi:hypothetical protein A2803_03985 [Candidatus Woesebacteria bacterium RIFCSPHIGHO2_01_FULL_44_21]|uniref:Glycosyl transferase family 1 domain-containing protein n=1 Tax=Candidatus Woesebacteria bacterium RIFCSPHIGHO2_01_FULL_44_21 TaxID=1802503 RepID=A0A1F7YXX9_9BACT|nr:MAG: hypothetical protein A2803_03985 [Candidatus Woesebacteria bacterium RIFCSPHIGHO2_01_FULL_44_21]